MFELDFELVAFDRGDGAVAELAVEDAHALAQVVAALVAEADGGGAGLGRGAVVEAGAGGEVPRRARLGFARRCSGRTVLGLTEAALEAGASGRGAH